MTVVTAHPDRRRQLANPDVWIFWRNQPSGRGRQGFACQPVACTIPGCPCTTTTVVGALVDDRITSVEATDEGLQFDYEPAEEASLRGEPEPEAIVLLVDDAARTIAAEDGDDAAAVAVATWLRGELDDEWLAMLQRSVAKQRAAFADELWRDWEPGDLVAHEDARPDLAFEPFAWNERLWHVADLHCIDAACPCQDVHIVIHEIDDEGEGAFAGSFAVTLPKLKSGETELAEPPVVNPLQLLAIWRTFCERRGDVAGLLGERRAQMKLLVPPQ